MNLTSLTMRDSDFIALKALPLVMVLTICAGILAALPNPALAFAHRHSKPLKQDPSVAAPRPLFRYVIIRGSLLHNGRVVLVLIDAKEFSEAKRPGCPRITISSQAKRR